MGYKKLKAIEKKILLASLSISVITPFSEGIVYAEDITVQPTNSSDNTVEINDSNYTINGTTKKRIAILMIITKLFTAVIQALKM